MTANKLSLDEMLALHRGAASRRRAAQPEHRLQCGCVRWFALRHPTLRGRLFAVPNGGRRDPTTAARLKAEGVVPGVADLILLKRNARHGALLIEMKTATGRQSEAQKRWQELLCAEGEYKYVVCRSLDDFVREVSAYLTNE